MLVDGWGRPFVVERIDGCYVITSMGRNGERDSFPSRPWKMSGGFDYDLQLKCGEWTFEDSE